jgi:hypothetical protein
MIIETMPEIKLYDIVRLDIGNRVNKDIMIVTNIKPNRPTNPLCGILLNGKGAEYSFGPKHKPVVIGTAPENHPALAAYHQRRQDLRDKIGGGLKPPLETNTKAIIYHLIEAVEAGDLPKAKILAAVVRTLSL